MAIFRCNKCGYLREVTNDFVGKSVHCPRCKQFNPIVDTVEFIEKVLANCIAQYCVTGLSQEQTRGLSSMYDVTFVNEKNFLQYVDQFILQKDGR